MAYGSKAARGKWKPSNPMKYRGDVNGIVYRSSWECKAFNWCDSRSNVVQWSSEEVIIPYRSPVDGKMHRYFVDLKFTVKRDDGVFVTYLAEIKPEKFTRPPVPRRKSKSYIEECCMWLVNEAKWEAAIKYSNERGWKFIIMTEKVLGIKT